ncbi:hypothetical protein [Actinomadura sp. 3N407]|uniref:hypothetical protein n=1 Tax=Actinomadura sp. 3N407 TaxID=3457423 RepID=UPI003FCD1595
MTTSCWWGDPAATDIAAEPAAPGPIDFFGRDLDRMNAMLHQLGAVRTDPDGFTWIDETKIPTDLASAYRGLARYGYANGLIA